MTGGRGQRDELLHSCINGGTSDVLLVVVVLKSQFEKCENAVPHLGLAGGLYINLFRRNNSMRFSIWNIHTCITYS